MHRDVIEHTKKQKKRWDIHPHWAVRYLHFTFSVEAISKMCRKEETCKTTVKKTKNNCLNSFTGSLSQAVSEAASFPGLCVPQHVKRVDYWNSMAKVIHAKRTTAWTVQASAQTKIPSNLRLCASREMIGTEKGGAERLLQTAQAQQTQQKKKRITTTVVVPFPLCVTCLVAPHVYLQKEDLQTDRPCPLSCSYNFSSIQVFLPLKSGGFPSQTNTDSLNFWSSSHDNLIYIFFN